MAYTLIPRHDGLVVERLAGFDFARRSNEELEAESRLLRLELDHLVLEHRNRPLRGATHEQAYCRQRLWLLSRELLRRRGRHARR